MGDYADCFWRVGTKLGRTIYAVTGDGSRSTCPAGCSHGDMDDVFLGLMETKELAQDVVDAHNDNLPLYTRMQGEEGATDGPSKSKRPR